MWPPVNSRNREREETNSSRQKWRIQWSVKKRNKTEKNNRKAVLYTFIRRRGDYTTIKRRIGVGEPSTFYDNENGKIHKNFQKEQSETPGNQKEKKKKSKVSVSPDRERKGSTPRRAGSERTRVRACPKKQKKIFCVFWVQNSSKK
jgi:hypothetical protein